MFHVTSSCPRRCVEAIKHGLYVLVDCKEVIVYFSDVFNGRLPLVQCVTSYARLSPRLTARMVRLEQAVPHSHRCPWLSGTADAVSCSMC